MLNKIKDILKSPSMMTATWLGSITAFNILVGSKIEPELYNQSWNNNEPNIIMVYHLYP